MSLCPSKNTTLSYYKRQTTFIFFFLVNQDHYTSEKLVKIHYRDLGINKKIENIKVDKETGQKSLIIKFTDGKYDFLPYDQPLHIIGDPEYLLQNHIENIIAQIKTKISQKKISVSHLAKQLKTVEK